jgi:hypothetical protein
MATTVLTVNPQIITVPANTNDHDIDVDAMIMSVGDILIDKLSGPVKFNDKGATTADSGSRTTDDKLVLNAQRGKKIHYAGLAGGETFQITVLR